MDRVILHCDCNSFFASVETVLDPSLKNVPMAVCGSEEDRHGIVLAKNELAKKYGIQTAETVHSARSKCPGLVIAKPHYKEYSEFSKRINDIYREYTDLVEPFGIDESWLDVTASRKLFGSGMKIAENIRQRIKKEIGLTVSIGVSFNKVFAKLGSDYKKPDAITEISRENFKDIVYPLPVSDLLLVGKKTTTELSRIGVNTIGDLAEIDLDVLVAKFGKIGISLYEYSRGLDNTPVTPVVFREGAKSIRNGFTFKHDLVTREECKCGIQYLCEEIGYKLRASEMKCSTVSLTIKDVYLKSIQRQKQLSRPTDIGGEIADILYEILCNTWPENKPIRMITATALGLLSSDSAKQIDIFENDVKDREKVLNKEKTIDKLRQKYGNSAIVRASFVDNSIGDFVGEDDDF